MQRTSDTTAARAVETWQAQFERDIHPAVSKLARQRFARERDRDELVQSALALAWKAFRRLKVKEQEERIFPSKIADFSCRQVRSGRQVGAQINTRDVLAPSCQRQRDFAITGFGDADELPVELHDAFIDHRRSSPADHAAFKIDFPMGSAPSRDFRAVVWTVHVPWGSGAEGSVVPSHRAAASVPDSQYPS